MMNRLNKNSFHSANSGNSALSSFQDEGDDSESLSGYDDLGDSDVECMQDKAAKETRENLAKGENKAVTALRRVVIMVLLCTAAGASVATYYYARGAEQSSFESEFASNAVVTLRSFVEAFEHQLSSMDAVATGITSHATRTGEAFPNVTVPDFEIKGGTVRTQTDSIFMFWLPLVTDDTRAGYEEYTKTMQAHLFQSYMVEEGLRQYQDAVFGINASETEAAVARAEEAEAVEATAAAARDGGSQRNLHVAPPDVHPVIHDTIWGLGGERGGDWPELPGTGPYLPTWQLSPTIPLPALLNFNFFSYTDLAPMFTQAIASSKATLSYLQTNHQGGDTEDLIRVFLTLNQYRHTIVDYNADPMTQVSYPVFDSFHPTEKNMSGVVLTTIFWRLLFVDILPDSVQGLVAVLSNSLGEKVTYRIDGRNAIYVGEGDLHETKYDDMVVTRDISEYMIQRAGPQSTSYTSIPLDTEYTSYKIHVYPSDDMKDTYMTKEPILFAVAVVLIFWFTSMVFLVYDYMVEKRQEKVMDSAVKSTAVVTSLFPTAVHDRLFAGKQEEKPEEKKNAWLAGADNPAAGGLQGSFTHVGHNSNSNLSAVSANKKNKGRPIADKFSDCSVYFADLAGFTKWSSTREPIEVFELLEALYGSFDKVATKRSVFKVETIGDCYMAATGLPNPQPDHAIRMVKFARDCMARMDRLLEQLSESLGADTMELTMRVGIHSGPVTAGVLRGDKGRFQLFGDTVNTASRMESNGIKGRIHVSASTAALLPEKWLTEREDKIVAKGKGEMTTYFVSALAGAMTGMTGIDVSHHSMLEDNDMDLPTLKPIDTTRSSTTADSENQFQRSFSFRNEPSDSNDPEMAPLSNTIRKTFEGRKSPLLHFGSSIAQTLGIRDEIEV